MSDNRGFRFIGRYMDVFFHSFEQNGIGCKAELNDLKNYLSDKF